jgi:hypothetical protein
VNVNQFVPLALAGSTPASGVVQTVYARFQRVSTSGSATVVLSSGAPSSSPGTSDRYEVVFAAGSTSGTTTVSRCTTTSCTSTTPLVNFDNAFLLEGQPLLRLPLLFRTFESM